MRTPPHRCPVPYATYPPALAPKRPDGHPRRDAVETNARTDPAGKEPAGSDSPRGRTTRSNQGPGAPARVDSHALSAHRPGISGDECGVVACHDGTVLEGKAVIGADGFHRRQIWAVSPRLGRWPDGRSISERHQPVL